ncbi:MAG TPA: DUF3617 family protein [Burkholderiales bacterium]
MKNSSLVYLLPILALASSPVAADVPTMQEGMWEITTKVDVSGLPEGVPEHTVQQCLTEKDFEEGKMHQSENQNYKCAVKDYKVVGNKASWSIDCSGDNPTTGSGSVTYSGTSFAGVSKMKMGKQGEEMEMTQTFSGKRIGACNQ